MKVKGRVLEAPKPLVLVIPRDDREEPVIGEDGQQVVEDGVPKTETVSGDIVIKAQAVVNYDEFDKLVPEPKVPKVLNRGDTKPREDPTNLKYQEALKTYNKRRSQYLFLKSLQPTTDLTWERTDLANPETWDNFEPELKEAGFTPIEIGRINKLVMDANGLDDERYNEARQRFLQSQAAAK